MTTEQQQSEFTGFAVVEAMGHQVCAGHVTVKRFGGAAFFCVVAEEQEPEELVLEEGRWIRNEYCAPGSRIRVTRQRVEKMYGAGSIYCITPCTEEEARGRQPTRIEVLERVSQGQLPGEFIKLDGDQGPGFDDEPEDDADVLERAKEAAANG